MTGLLTAAGAVATAIALGASLVVIMLLVFGFGSTLVLGYILDKSGFQKATAVETWSQQFPALWWPQVNIFGILYAEYKEMSHEERMKRLEFFLTRIGIPKEYIEDVLIGDGEE
jgi:hypothetical protein